MFLVWVNKINKNARSLNFQVDFSKETTREVIEKIGFLQRTLFGDLWDLKNDMNLSDTAYTNVELAPHTDGTYMQEAPG